MRNILRSNFMFKVLSVLIAFILWFYVLNIQNPKDIKEVDIPIKLDNIYSVMDKGMILGSNQKYTVTLKVQGRRLTLNKISPSDFGARVNLDTIEKIGQNELQVEIYKYPKELEIVGQSPQIIILHVYKKK